MSAADAQLDEMDAKRSAANTAIAVLTVVVRCGPE
jgi:hypothetical protein